MVLAGPTSLVALDPATSDLDAAVTLPGFGRLQTPDLHDRAVLVCCTSPPSSAKSGITASDMGNRWSQGGTRTLSASDRSDASLAPQSDYLDRELNEGPGPPHE